MCFVILDCKLCEGNTQPGFDYCNPRCRDQHLDLCFKVDGIAELEDAIKNNPVELEKCRAKDCHKPVFRDYQKNIFLYCSPSCRDTDILTKCQEKLRKDIELMESTILKSKEVARACSYTKFVMLSYNTELNN